MAGTMTLSPDFSDFIKSLNDSEVRYLVVGGYAVALHGHPRYTKDIDIWVERTETNASQIIEALTEFGFGSLGLIANDFLTEDQIIQLGYPPNRIDILTSIPGVDFTTCYTSRLEVQIGGLSVAFIDLDNLKRAKMASGRPQDLADVDNLR